MHSTDNVSAAAHDRRQTSADDGWQVAEPEGERGAARLDGKS